MQTSLVNHASEDAHRALLAAPATAPRRAGVRTAAARLVSLGNELGLATWAWRVAAGRFDELQALVEVIRVVLRAQAVALFDVRAGSPRLRASQGLTQVGLECVRAVDLSELEAWVDVQTCGRKVAPALLVWCRDGDVPAGVLYLEGPQVLPSRPLLSSLGQGLARVLCDVEGGLSVALSALTPEVDAPGDRHTAVALRVLMEQHEWNVSRVARVLGVTRMTVYNRLRRAGVKRQHVRKSRWRRKGAPTAAGPAAPAMAPDGGAAAGLPGHV